MQAVRLVAKPVRPAALVTPEGVENALRALGGSTSALVHLAAIAGRAGVPLNLRRLDALSEEAHVLVDLEPTGDGYMEDFGRPRAPRGRRRARHSLPGDVVALKNAGPLALVGTGDRVRLSVRDRRPDLLVEAAEVARRRAARTPPPVPRRGWDKLMHGQVLQAPEGADLGFLRPDGR